MIQNLVPPLMDYDDTVEYLLTELLFISEAECVTMINGNGLKRTVGNPQAAAFCSGVLLEDLTLNLAGLNETILISKPGLLITPEKASAIAEVCARALENALKFQLMRKNISTDELTGLINKNTLKKRVEQEIAYCERTGGCFGIAFIDLDNFKDINDTFGHLVGDAVLAEIAGLLQESFRQGNIIARFGGDEFIILFKDVGRDLENLLLKRILDAMQQIKKAQFPISASVGFSYYPEDGCEFASLIAKADHNMYLAKQKTRECIL